VSIEEKDSVGEIVPAKTAPGAGLDREQAFLIKLNTTPDGVLVKPFGRLNWLLFGPLLGCLAAALLFFTHNLNIGTADVNWTISFDVNLVAGIIVLLAGAAGIVPKVVKDPQVIRSQTTLASTVLVALVAAFFLFRVLDLGTFTYTLDKLDLSAVAGLVFVAGIIVLAFRGSPLSLMALGGLFLWWGFSIDGFGFVTVNDLFTSENGGRLLRSLTPPKWDYFSKVIDPMLLTVQTAVAATVIGVIIALPLSILAARNTSPHPLIYGIVRLLINTVRAIPALILALLFIPFVGLGPGAGVLGLGIHSISVLTKLYAEAFESVKPQPLEALNAVGANGLKTFRWGVFPQAFPLVASYSIFNWESNGRDSTVVAFVGGGGIGFLLQANLSLLNYANVAVLLVVLVITVALLDRFSDFVRSKII
jgi:phosphonate transport system permease protein